MKLTSGQIAQYHDTGFLLAKDVFSGGEISLIRQEMNAVILEDCDRRILEKNGSVRSFFAPDLSNELFERIVRLRRLVVPSCQLLGTEVYPHQTKINAKAAMTGDWWEWHQDYTFWKNDDGMPAPDVLTAMIYLNDVTEFNGPMLLIPGTHKAGTIGEERQNGHNDDTDYNQWFEEYKASTFYMTALTADLKYTLQQYEVAAWALRKGMVSAKGPAGSVLFFHGNIFHASSNNMSPWDRHAFLITYNSVTNTLREVERPRPDFIARRNFEPVTVLCDSL